MSIFGRLAAGAGAAAASIANKYIDESIAEQKARFLADLQVETSGRIDDLTNDPARRARKRGEDVADATATQSAKAKVDLESKIAETASPELTAATEARTRALMPVEQERAGLLERAKARNQAYDLSPGQERRIGDELLASNKRPTSQEVQAQLYREGLKGLKSADGKPFKLDEDTKLLLNDLNKQGEKLQEMIDKASLDPLQAKDKDGNPNPAIAALRQRAAGIELRKTRLLADAGVIDGGAIAADLLRSNPTPEELQRSIEQAKQVGGKFAAAAIPAFQQALAGSMSVKNTPPNAGPQPAAPGAPGAAPSADVIPGDQLAPFRFMGRAIERNLPTLNLPQGMQTGAPL